MPYRFMMLVLALLATPVAAQEQAMLDNALDAASATLGRALPSLGSNDFGVDVAAYRDALDDGVFQSAMWGGRVRLDFVIAGSSKGSCGRFAAYVRVPPEDGAVRMVLCPQFFTAGAHGLRQLTILHELVHVVSGTDECQAMAFAARVQASATGSFTPVEAYWRANGCANSAYRLP